MQEIVKIVREFLNLSPQKKNYILLLLIIFGLCYLLYYQKNVCESNYKNLKIDYDILINRRDTIPNYYQKKIDKLQEIRILELQEANNKMEDLYKKYEKFKTEIE